MITSPFSITFTTLIALTIALASPALGTIKKQHSWDFEKDKVNQLAKGFYFDETGDASKSKWRVSKEGDNQLLSQIANVRGSTPYALAVAKDTWFKDVSLETRIKAGKKREGLKAGIVWRYRNSENYLVACIDFAGQRVRLYRVVRGSRVMFGSSEKIKLGIGSWYTLRVEHRGDRIKVYLNNEAFIIEEDKHYRKAGKVGLWTQTGSATYFDDFGVRRLENRN